MPFLGWSVSMRQPELCGGCTGGGLPECQGTEPECGLGGGGGGGGGCE